MRVLLVTLTEGPADIAPEIAMALLNVVDRPRTRVFLDGGVDLEVKSYMPRCCIPIADGYTFVLRWRWRDSRMRMGRVRLMPIECARQARSSR